MGRRVRTLSIVLSIFLGIGWFTMRVTSTQVGPAYGVADVGTIGGTTTVVYGLTTTALPSFAGFGQTASGAEHAFISTAAGAWPPRLVDLGTLGGARSEA